MWPIFKPVGTKVKEESPELPRNNCEPDSINFQTENFYSGDSKDTVRSNGKCGIIKNKATQIRRRRYKPITSISESEQIAHRAKRVLVQRKSLAKRSVGKKEADLQHRREMNRAKAEVRTEEEWQERRDYANGWKAAERNRQSYLVYDLCGAYEQRMVKFWG